MHSIVHVLTRPCSCFDNLYRWLHQTSYTWFSPRACRNLPFPSELADSTSLLRPLDVALGRPLSVPEHLQRHETSI
jgi:hypothetical protein